MAALFKPIAVSEKTTSLNSDSVAGIVNLCDVLIRSGNLTMILGTWRVAKIFSLSKTLSAGGVALARLVRQLSSHPTSLITQNLEALLAYPVAGTCLRVLSLPVDLDMIGIETPTKGAINAPQPTVPDGSTNASHVSVPRSTYQEPPRYFCRTCFLNHCSLYVGRNDTIDIWEPFTIIKFYVDRVDFGRMHEDYRWTVKCLRVAGNEWNKDVHRTSPRPRFEQVDSLHEANCVVTYRHDDKPSAGGKITCADAFFPDGWPVMHVYTASFSDTYRPWLANIFFHELSHIQGLRHEFAHKEDILYNMLPAASIGEDDEQSVTNYFDEPRDIQIQDSDRKSVEELYALPGDFYESKRIVRHRASPFDDRRSHLQTDGDSHCLLLDTRVARRKSI